VELKSVEKRLNELEAQFLTQLDGLLKRKVLTERAFTNANEKARSEKTELVARKEELIKLLSQARASESLIQRVPKLSKPSKKLLIAWNCDSRRLNCKQF
jgi:hypothetical protein